jgi:hypothetical protein
VSSGDWLRRLATALFSALHPHSLCTSHAVWAVHRNLSRTIGCTPFCPLQRRITPYAAGALTTRLMERPTRTKAGQRDCLTNSNHIRHTRQPPPSLPTDATQSRSVTKTAANLNRHASNRIRFTDGGGGGGWLHGPDCVQVPCSFSFSCGLCRPRRMETTTASEFDSQNRPTFLHRFDP